MSCWERCVACNRKFVSNISVSVQQTGGWWKQWVLTMFWDFKKCWVIEDRTKNECVICMHSVQRQKRCALEPDWKEGWSPAPCTCWSCQPVCPALPPQQDVLRHQERGPTVLATGPWWSKMRADFFPDGGTVKRVSANRATPNSALQVKRREAFTRANVGLSRAIGTTIIVSPLDMAGQPGACIVTAVLQAGFAIVDTTAYGKPKSRQPLIHRFAQVKTWRLASMDERLANFRCLWRAGSE